MPSRAHTGRSGRRNLWPATWSAAIHCAPNGSSRKNGCEHVTVLGYTDHLRICLPTLIISRYDIPSVV